MRQPAIGRPVSDARLLAPGVRNFVGLMFAVLGGSFVLSTGTLIAEFPNEWRLLLFAHSHRFFFFPVLGVAALACFYIPAVVLTDLYWRSGLLKRGRLRFTLGFIAAVIVSVGFALSYAGLSPLGSWHASAPATADGDPAGSELRRSIWELSPRALEANMAAGTVILPDCRTWDGRPCPRLPVVEALAALRKASMSRWTITEFARPCSQDGLVEKPAAYWVERHCFPAGVSLNAPDCCKVQASLAAEMSGLMLDEKLKSRVGVIEGVVTGLKSFFVIVVIVVGIMLAFWREKLVTHYRPHLDAIERGVIVGATLMLVWLLMDYGFQQTGDVLFGRLDRHFPVRASLTVGVLALALIIYFLNRSVYNPAQLFTIAGSAFAVLNYETIGNLSARLLGTGAPAWVFALLTLLGALAVFVVYGPWKLPLPPRREHVTDNQT